MATIQQLFDATRLDMMEVEGFTYRTATVVQRFLELPRDMMCEFGDKLAEMAGWNNGNDNHTAFRLTEKYTQEKKTIYVSFSDNVVAFGLSIEKRCW